MKLNTVSFTQFKNAIPVRSAVTTSNDPNVFGFDHIDSKGNLVDPQSSIAKLEFNDGEGRHIDGFRVTYRYKGPNSSEVEPEVVVHGTFNEDEVHHKAVTLDVDEYICAARVWYAKGDEEYIGRITLWARSPKSKHAYQAGDWGDVPDGEFEIDEWQWENKDGRLLAFGAKQDLSAGEKGLKAVAFGVFQGQFAVAQSALYPERDASSQANAKAFDDLEKYGQNLNYEHPIKSVEVWHDRVIHGIRITYQLNHKATTATEMHGSKTTSQPTLIQLKETESIVEVTGVHGVACPDTNWGNRINILDFKIFDKKTGMFRNSGTCGKLQDNFQQNTRRDICARGPLVGVAGWADPTQKPGLYNLKFFTRVPPWKPNSVRF